MLRATGMPRSRITVLKTSLSMQSAEASDAGADVGDAGELEQALHGAVLAERAVQDRQHDVDGAERRRAPSRPGPAASRQSSRGQLGLASRRVGSAQRPSRPISTVRDLVARPGRAPRAPSAPTRGRSRARSSGRPPGRRAECGRSRDGRGRAAGVVVVVGRSTWSVDVVSVSRRAAARTARP